MHYPESAFQQGHGAWFAAFQSASKNVNAWNGMMNLSQNSKSTATCFNAREHAASSKTIRRQNAIKSTDKERQFDKIDKHISTYSTVDWNAVFSLETSSDDNLSRVTNDDIAKPNDEKVSKYNFFTKSSAATGNDAVEGGIDDFSVDIEIGHDYHRQIEMFGNENRANNSSFSEDYVYITDNLFDNDEKALSVGLQLFDRGECYESIMAFESAVKQNPNDSFAWVMIGFAQADSDLDNLALYAFNQAIKINPTCQFKVLIPLAVSYANEFMYKEALLSLHKWIDSHSKYQKFSQSIPSNIRFNKKIVCQLLEMFLKANEYGDDAGLDFDLHVALGLLYHLISKYDKVIEHFQLAVTIRPRDYSIWNKLGATLANCNTHEKSVEAYIKALEIRPTYVRALCNLGVSWLAIRDYEKASKAFLRALSVNPHASHRWKNLKDCFNNMGRTDLALHCLEPNIEFFKKTVDF